MDDITPEQLSALQKFREVISDVKRPCHDDYSLYKWLKARKFDVQKAEDMYRKSMTWRSDVGADTILTDYTVPEVMAKHYPGGICGHDRSGRPIWIDPLGRADLKGLMYSVKKSDIVRSMVHRLEHLHNIFEGQTAKERRQIDQCVHILDMDGFGPRFMWKPALDLYIEILHILESNYPETLRRTYIINAPKVFQIGYNIIKKFIDKNTVAKFVLCDSNWKETVSRDIILDQLPEYYGGKACDPDGNPRCETMICYGGDVPKEHYRRKEEFFPKNLSPTNSTLKASGSLSLTYTIPDTSYVIRWIFATDLGDMEFGVYRDTKGLVTHSGNQKAKIHRGDLETLEVLQNPNKYTVNRVPEDGMLICDTAGTYVLRFKNPSRFYKRNLTHVIEIVKVGDDQMLEDVSNTMKQEELIDSEEGSQ